MRYLAWFCFSSAGAIFALQYGPEKTVAVLLILTAVLAIGALFLRKTKRMAALLLAFGVAFGSCYSVLYDAVALRPVGALEDTEGTVCVTLSDYPQGHTYGAKCTALLDAGSLVPIQVQLYSDESLLSCAPGDKVRTEVKIRSAGIIRDEEITAFTSKGSHLLLYGRGTPEIERADEVPLRYWPLRLNRLLQERIAEIYTGEPQLLVTALLTGNRIGFDDTMYSMLSETGVTHITAVSGMHCAFLFGMIRLLMRNRRRAAAVGIPILFLFMLMVGATPSVMRACFMLTLLSLAPLLGRENDSITTIGVALFLILLQNPYAAASISLQLSFLSVAGILLFSHRIYESLMKKTAKGKGKKRLLSLLFSAVATTIGASVLTVPLVACYFDCVSLISPLTNLLCLSAASFAFYGGIVSLLVSALSLPVAQMVAIFPAAALEYFMAVVRQFTKNPNHAIYTSNPYLMPWLVYFYGILAVLFFSKKRKGRTVALGAALSVASLCIVIALPVSLHGRAELTARVLNVGQGESVLFASGGSVALLDCGSTNSWINAGSVAANEINTLGYTTLDYLILTHYHADHTNGLDTLFSRVNVKTLIAPEMVDEESIELQTEILTLAEASGTEVVLMDASMELALGMAEILLYPPQGAGSTNEQGLTLLCSLGDFDMLVTGDMDSKTERTLVKENALPDIEVLVVGHHGSKYSTALSFLEAVTPEDAIISVGSNSYGHPSAETLFRLEHEGVDVRRTDQGGTVSITVY